MSINDQIAKFSDDLFAGIVQIIEQAWHKTAVFLNTETTLLYWNIGHYINENLKVKNRLEYGGKILATLSQQLSWSHFLELATISDELKRQFYIMLSVQNNLGVRDLPEQMDKMLYERTALAQQSENEIKKQLQQLKNQSPVNLDLVF